MFFNQLDPLADDFSAAIEAVLTEIMADRRAEVVACNSALGPVVDLLTPLALGGKHIRSAFCWWGYAAIADQPSQSAGLLKLAASLDLIHAGLLAHDDLIDQSETRRGRPSSHLAVAALAPGGDASLGLAGAVIGGSWLLQWAQQAIDESGLELDQAARADLNRLRTRVLAGQMADAWAAAGLPLLSGGQPLSPAATVGAIGELKTASYTVAGPTRLGALVAGAEAAQLAALDVFGQAAGRAYQLRDDILGVFGDTEATGKPAGDDLRQGKKTLLVETALAGLSDRADLLTVIGNLSASPAQIDRAKQIIIDCGALAVVEQVIETELASALQALSQSGLTQAGRTGLTALAEICARRAC